MKHNKAPLLGWAVKNPDSVPIPARRSRQICRPKRRIKNEPFLGGLGFANDSLYMDLKGMIHACAAPANDVGFKLGAGEKRSRLMTRTSFCLRRGFAAMFSLAVVFSGGFAQAQTADCSCLVPQASAPGTPVGRVVDISGNNVVLSGPAGPGRAVVGAPLQVGDTLTVGPASSAAFVVGSCSQRLSAKTEMTISPVNGKICVAVNEAGAPVFSGAGPVILGGVVLAGGAAIILSLGSDTPASP